MLASGADEEVLKHVWGNKHWICEEKLDGSRYILQFNSSGRPLLTSRKISVKTNLPVDKTANLRGYVVGDCMGLAGTILDGEIVGGDSFGNTVSLMGSSPERAQKMLKDGFRVRYCVYDILQYRGEDMRDVPLGNRKAALQRAVDFYANPYIEYVKTLPNKEQSYLDIVKNGGEGVILKMLNGLYVEGDRSKHWLKVKKSETYDGVILGFTEGNGKYENLIGSIRVGQMVNGSMDEVATISGMNDEDREHFTNNQYKYIGKVVEFKAQQKTEARYRHPVFVRVRHDKSPNECKF